MRAALVALLVTLALAPAADARTLLVVGQSGVDKADAFEAGTGVKPAGAMWYLGVYEEQPAVDAVLGQIREAVASHPGLVVNLGLSFGSASTPSPPYTPAIAAGAYDATLERIAAGLKDLPAAVSVRPGYEFVLFGGQSGAPEAYKAAYRHVADKLRAANTRFVWHSAGAFWRAADPSLFATGSGTVAHNARGGPELPISAFYPGREYVDAFGISYWQDSCCAGRSSEQARDEYEHRTPRSSPRPATWACRSRSPSRRRSTSARTAAPTASPGSTARSSSSRTSTSRCSRSSRSTGARAGSSQRRSGTATGRTRASTTTPTRATASSPR